MSLTAEDLAATLEEIALLLELKGENPFKTRAYRNGADIIRDYEGDFFQKAKDNDLKGIKGIGEALQEKLHELARTGKLDYYLDLKHQFPETLFELFELQGLGPKKIKVLYEELGIATLGALKRACADGSVAELKGFGKKTAEKILAAIATHERFSGRYRLADAAHEAEPLRDYLREHPAVHQLEIAGSYRRGKETVHDLDFLVATDRPAELTEYFASYPGSIETIAQGETKAAIRLENGLQCDLRAVSSAQFPFALQYFTGSKEHNVALRSRAKARGWSLNEYDFSPIREDADERPPIETEADLYAALHLAFVPPPLRENRGEIEAAAENELPPLLQQEHLRGTFHNHTTASDGRNTLREMAEAARELGMDYLGISDHSKSSPQANGLDEERLHTQIAEIRALNEELDGSLHLFAGSEVDILKDGSLDFDDDLLSELDYVVASVHNSFSLPEAEMTARVIRAIENPHVTMLGHSTGRLLLRREAYPINLDKIIDAAAANETIIELNCSAKRMDMDWRYWKRARDKGVLCSINPDAHSTSQLQALHFGVRVAQKGWLRKEDVFNTRTLAEVRAYLQK
ncbi:DNA polymerase/3'-5' exonuclease PolX [Roseibacillus ishigakijimensis]|uniref:DNA polymerase beta n=1 Tax=Roseibacillus ishigakijimensis TaxID=454146 RepID=A0A934VL17_9BACT|nr:DNA polymerase/3'-5' exonuclease PolX [Roseibacillus ishigakijimensis]MBK1832757.1 DNA polymerase/3'-5' exonuclease PolX [Roseibacillus ishigakijimensis]